MEHLARKYHSQKFENLSLSMFKKAAYLGSKNAQCMCAGICFKKQDYPEAIKFFSLSARSGEDIALVMLGTLYATGRHVKRDQSKAFEMFVTKISLFF